MTLVSDRPSDQRLTPTFVSGIRPLVVLVCAALAGLFAAHVLDLHEIHRSSSYVLVVTVLLAIGIYGSTSGISIVEMKRNARTILLAVTIGVLAKAALISLVMLWIVGDPVYAVLLGVAVAQIDPLAVAGLVSRSRMSESAKTVLRAWSSFDDPVTMILTVYLLTFAGWSGSSSSAGESVSASPLALAGGFAANFGFAFVVWVGYRAVKGIGQLPALRAVRSRPVAVQAVGGLALLGVGFVAVEQFYLLGLAVIGLFLRPGVQAVLDRLTRLALLLATAALGMLLAGGVDWGAGIALGVSAYLAQAVLAPIVTRRHSFTDKVSLALGQQNGITAITLALLAEPVFPKTVSVIAPAILVINGLHAVCETVWDRASSPHPRPVPARKPGPVAIRPDGVPPPVAGMVPSVVNLVAGFPYAAGVPVAEPTTTTPS
jgi:NhaP-type Na+/H+ or K+/H+ antiporter